VRGDPLTTRRAFIGTLAGGLLARPLAAEAQVPAKVPRIGFLATPSSTANGSYLEAFREGLRELGYVEGKTIVIELSLRRWQARAAAWARCQARRAADEVRADHQPQDREGARSHDPAVAPLLLSYQVIQ
jgi:hypothetical protein